MLTHPTLDQLNALGLQGMAKAFAELDDSKETAGLRHAEWLALLLEREAVHRHDKRLAARLQLDRPGHRQASRHDLIPWLSRSRTPPSGSGRSSEVACAA